VKCLKFQGLTTFLYCRKNKTNGLKYENVINKREYLELQGVREGDEKPKLCKKIIFENHFGRIQLDKKTIFEGSQR
jgi:hypothetical protein